MRIKKDNEAQINILTTKEKKEALQKIARIRSIELDKDISYTDILRELIDQIILTSGSVTFKSFSG